MTDANSWWRGRLLALGGVVVLVATWIAASFGVGEWELDVTEAVNRWPSVVGYPLEVAMQAGSRLAVPVVAAAAGLASRAWRPALAVLVAGALAWGLSAGAKEVVDRDRPAPAGAAVEVRSDADGPGYPSGHATLAAALAASVPRRWRAPAAAVAAATAVARLYVGVHLPLDALGGLALGGITGFAASSLTNRRRLWDL